MEKPVTTSAQATALACLDGIQPSLSAWTRTIFDFGETAWREYQSAAWYIARLKHEGFSVEQGSAGMPTAFCAHWTNGPGPTIGMYAEYDAVPGKCQDAVTCRKPPRRAWRERRRPHRSAFRRLAWASLGGFSPPRRRWNATASAARCASPASRPRR